MIIERRIILALQEKPRSITEAAKIACTVRGHARHLMKRLLPDLIAALGGVPEED